MVDVIELEVFTEPEIELSVDFKGEFVSGSDGEDYKRGYNEGHEKGYTEGEKEGYNTGYDQGLIDGKQEEQEKSVTITENGTTEILPDENKVLSKVTVDVDVKGGDFIGVKYSDFSGLSYNLPRTADARSFDLILEEPSVLDEQNESVVKDAENGHALSYLFANPSKNANGGYFTQLENVYLPLKATKLINTFQNCSKLKNIYGDLTNIDSISVAFQNCANLTEIPYMPNLINFGNQSFYGCTGLTSITFYKVLTTWHTGALQGATNITEINLVDGWNTAVCAQHCTNLSQASLHDMIEKLADMTGQTPLVFKIGEGNIEKIDEEHLTMLDNKNIDYS